MGTAGPGKIGMRTAGPSKRGPYDSRRVFTDATASRAQAGQ